MFENEVRAHVRKTGQPETFEALFHGRIAKTEPFIILSRIDIDRRKRPEGDKAPCPMCQPNKFLHGYLCWFHERRLAAVIGHCCADKDVAAAAERRFRAERDRKHEEDYLMVALPLVGQKLDALKVVRRSADEALRLYRKMRGAKSVHAALREIAHDGGRLILHEEVGEAVKVVGGPDNFRRKGKIEFRQVDLGKLDGLTATLTNYNPVKEHEWIERTLEPLNVGNTEEEVVEFICTLDDRRRHIAAILLRDADKRFGKMKARLEDFASFFAKENLRRLDDWGGHEANRIPIRVTERRVAGQRRLEISVQGDVAALSPNPVLWGFEVEWPEPVLEKD
jgi:hypothetical protein